MALSALSDKAKQPSSGDLARVLGPSLEAWLHLVSRMVAAHGPLTQAWHHSGPKYGWSCRLVQKRRTILYLTPQEGSFLVGLVLGDRALTLLRRGSLSAASLALIDEAPRYAEGTGFRIPVASVEDCREVEVVVEAKMA